MRIEETAQTRNLCDSGAAVSGHARASRGAALALAGGGLGSAEWTPAADEPRRASNPMQNRPIHSPRTNRKYRPEQTRNAAGGQRVPYKTAPRRICVGVRGWGPERQARPREEDARLSSGSNSRTVRNPSRSSACGASICKGVPARTLASEVPRYFAMASDSRALSRASRMPASGLAGSTLICFDGSESGRPAGSDQKAPWLGWGFETGEGWLGGLVHNQENVKKNLGVQFRMNDFFFARYEGQFEELK